MKKTTKMMIAGAMIAVVAAGAFMAGHFVSVNRESSSVSVIGGADGPTSVFLAGKTQEGEKQVAEYLILDVRRADEFAEGHIPGAVNVANEDIRSTEPEELPDKDQVIYVYCRSGRRSKEAAAKLAELGYTNIVECGGILDWTGDVEK